MTNVRQEAAQRFAPSLAAAAEAVALLLSWNSRIDDALEGNQQELRATTESYEEYIDASLEAIVVTRRQSEQWADNMRDIALLGSLSERHAAEWGILTQAQFENLQLATAQGEAWDRNIVRLGNLMNVQDNFVSSTNTMIMSNMTLEQRVQALGAAIQSTFSDDFADAQEEIADLRAEAEDLEGTVQDLEGRQYLTTAQQEELEATRQALEGVQQEIDETTAAWDRQTAQMIFDMAQQRLAIDGLTADEFEALTALAGPEGLGLIDEVAVQAAESVNAALVAFEDTGDVEDFTGHMMDLQEVVSNTDQNLGDMEQDIANISATFELAQDPIEDYREALLSIPPQISTILQINQVITTTGTLFDLGTGTAEAFATGGNVGAGQLVRINEFGEEFFMPDVNGTILPASTPVGGGAGGQGGVDFTGMSAGERLAFAEEIGQSVATALMTSGENL